MSAPDAPGQNGLAEREPGSIMDWERTGHRIRRSALVIGMLVLVVWIVTGLAGDGITLPALGSWVGVGLGAMVFTELVVVGTAAMQAERRAARHGERLSRSDVGLLPPRRRRDDDADSSESPEPVEG
jgi:hypothetical protein